MVDTLRNKIKGLDDLASLLDAQRAQGKRIVQCHGVFDLLHIGHIRHFEQARKLGDVLIVTLTPDVYVNKGPHRPAFGEGLRAEAIAALESVDYVAVNQWPTAKEAIERLRPDVYVKGSEYRNPVDDKTGGISAEAAAVASVGGRVAFTDDITFSSSTLLNKHMPLFPEEIGEYLAGFSRRHLSKDILKYVEAAKGLKTLIVGEAIIDEYVYCETLGKSGKEPVLAARVVEVERFAGGALAVANNVGEFCDRVGLLTLLGGSDSQEDFINQRLRNNIERVFLHAGPGVPTIVKRRFVEMYPFQKLFEVYVMSAEDSALEHEAAVCAQLEALVPGYDVVVVMDYGHGMLGPKAVEVLSAKSRFLAVNTQVNAGNRGFNTVSKYPRADLICVSEHEMRIEARSQTRPLREIVSDIAARLLCSRVLITQGQKGCLAYGGKEGFFEVPAFAVKVADRLGAGDAMLSLASLCAAQGASMEVVGFVGNAAGAQAVGIVGHRKSVERVPLMKSIEALLK